LREQTCAITAAFTAEEKQCYFHPILQQIKWLMWYIKENLWSIFPVFVGKSKGIICQQKSHMQDSSTYSVRPLGDSKEPTRPGPPILGF